MLWRANAVLEARSYSGKFSIWARSTTASERRGDGKLSGRGSPWKRGLASGVMTAIGGLGHALPYLIPSFWTATIIALIVVFIELWVIAFIQNRYMETPFLRAAFQVVLGGGLVLAAGILIGGA
jgi:VIT1/CCC1 family predicted Fe2+/Mn2+ transporter